MLLRMLWSLSRLVPRNKSLWIVGNQRPAFDDNSKYMFLFLHHHTDIDVVWISKDRGTCSALKKLGYKACRKYSLRAFYYSIRAGVVLTSAYITDVLPVVLNGAFWVNLWHGTPLKFIGFDACIHVLQLLTDKELRRKPWHKATPDLFLLASSSFSPHIQSAFRIDKERIFISGYPRNDYLKAGWDGRVRKIIYLPTFRWKYFFDMFSYGFCDEEWREFLAENDIRLDLKLHPVDNHNRKTFQNRFRDSSHINVLDGEGLDLYEVLPNYDLLITDYSSVMFDWALMERPMLIGAFDLDRYRKTDRDIYRSLEEIVPYYQKDWKEVLAVLKSGDFEESLAQVLRIKTSYNDKSETGRYASSLHKEILARLNPVAA